MIGVIFVRYRSVRVLKLFHHHALRYHRYVFISMSVDVLITASYTGSSSDEDDVNPREKQQVLFSFDTFISKMCVSLCFQVIILIS